MDVTIPTEYGPIVLPFEQAVAMAHCLEKLRAAGKTPTWHRNACGCCVSVHELADHAHEGYVVGADGGVDWIVLASEGEQP